MEYIIHSISRKGSLHKDYNEDFLLVIQQNEYLLAAVFDGCSTGRDSHFASALFAKTLRKSFLEFSFENEKNLSGNFFDLIKNFVNNLNQIKNILQLPQAELLSTAIVTLLNTNTLQAEILVSGDGFVSLNHQNHEINQNNTPNYLAYYLENIEKNDTFAHWYLEETVHFSCKNTQKLSISTDGIFTFKSENVSEEKQLINPITYLINDVFLLSNKTMLSRKLNILKNKFALAHADDVSVIRIEQKE